MFKSFLLLAGFSVALGHDWGFGACPEVPPVPNFSVNKFLGKWFVIEEFDADSQCVTVEFTPNTETSLFITKRRQFPLLDAAGLNHTSTYEGHLDIPMENNQAFMRIKWPLNIVGKADFIVFDTDYETYAGIYDCQQLSALMYRQSASILSRKTALDKLFVDRVKRRLTTFEVEQSDFSRVSHDNCREVDDSSMKLDFNRYTLSNFVNRTSNAVSEIASQVADGAVNAANTVSDGAMQVVKDVSNTFRTAADAVVDNVQRMGFIPTRQ